ncbi:MAG: hypothetical protein GX213_11140 [Clostridiaceae bacterium]|nr:hypothetical protein [Clostridiaceae bacterium]
MKAKKHILYLCLIAVMITVFMCGCAGNNNQQQNDQVRQQNDTAQKDTENGMNAENNDDTANSPAPSPTIEEAGIRSGMYKVGQDIAAGEYKLYSTADLSYFEIAKDSSNTLESIIANDNFYSFTYVTVADGQYFKFTDARAVPVSDATASGPKDGRYPSGMYKVGFDIPAGEYQVFPEEGSTLGFGYYEITSGSSHVLDDIVANDNFEDPRYITLKEGQYVKLSEAYIKAK